MDSKLEKLFEKLEGLKDKENDILEEIKNRLYDLDDASEEDDFEDEEEDDFEDEEEDTDAS